MMSALKPKTTLGSFQELIKRSTFDKTQAMVGQTLRVLAEEPANRRQGYLHGTADNTRSVILKQILIFWASLL